MSIHAPAPAPTAFALATPHALATAAGEQAVRDGGNAVDAAIAAAIALTVVYPHQCAVGGDLIALVARPGRHPVAVNGSGAAPMAADPDALAGAGGMPITGPLSVTVPGVVAGWATLSRTAGRLPFDRLFTSAIAYAQEGVPTAPGVAHALTLEQPLLAPDEGMREVFFAAGRPLAAGEPLVQPALARTLAAIADHGPDALYHGEIGASIVGHLRSLGSPITRDDLARHRTETTEPIGRTFRGEEYLTAPPNSQGQHLLQILGAVERLDPGLDLLGADAAVLARVFRQAANDRDTFLADPRYAPVPVDDLLGAARIARIAEAATDPDAHPGGPSPTAAAQAARPSGDTVAVVAMDAEGNAVSLIQSLFHSFGSGILDPATGVVLHNRGSFFSLLPGAPNRLRGGSRPAHTLMPVLTRRDGAVTGAHGTMGGKAQPQIHAHLALRLHAGDSVTTALHSPRWVVGGMEVDAPTDAVFVEPDVPAAAIGSLRGMGAQVQVGGTLDEQVGHGQLVRVGPGGTLHAAADPRSDGAAISRA
ncbi:gamma-glutamyltransferase family protein [Kitasatospora sp. NPDC088548]|uniref:gamma-glutamyltransferase family protein n=1 Tax=Kitasatospora sp. NPDC088548 TaxID=3364075 RepID=UPI0038002D98